MTERQPASDYEWLIDRGCVERWFDTDADAERWRRNMRSVVRQDRLRVRTFKSAIHGRFLAIAILPNFRSSERQQREMLAAMNRTMAELLRPQLSKDSQSDPGKPQT